jgi:hypothetical protein
MDFFVSVAIGIALTLGLIWAWTRFWSFPAQSPEDYAGTGPAFDIRKHLKGPILCEGVIYGPTGRVTSRFVADFDASWDGDEGTMTEEFRYDSGEKQSRYWKLKVLPDGRIEADAPDLVGKGSGQQKGSGVQLNYRIKLAEDAGGHELDTVDWMYLMENGSIMNRSQFRKYGIKVAELVATMRPKVDA